METITLIGIIVTFVTTIVGWYFTYRTQLSIMEVQSDYQYHKEQQKILVDDNLTFLQDLHDWFEKGRKVYLKAAIISSSTVNKVESADIEEKESIARIQRITARPDEERRMVSDLGELRAASPRLYYLAKIYDPLAEKSPLWTWGDPDPPKDLPQLIDNFENEILDQVDEMIFGDAGRAFPKIEDQFYALHEAGIRAIERVKAHVVFQEMEKGVKK